jgi:Tfp pilus assembly protein PilO
MAVKFSSKQLQIDKAKAFVVGSVGVAIFILIFTIFISRALLSQRAYQSRVIKEQETAVKQLNENKKAVARLGAAYKQFVEQPTNVIGGSSSAAGDRDGDNARIVLDALPSKYDFPALASSLDKILSDQKFKVSSFTGVDDEIAQSASKSGALVPIEIPFTFSVSGSYSSVQGLIDTLDRSIRPIKIKTLSLAGKSSDLQLTLSATTYYLPEKQLTFPTKEVK